MTKGFSQAGRAVFFILYMTILVILNSVLFGEVVPTGMWFWSASLALFLSEFITQPYFTAPKDALTNSITAIAVIVSLLSAPDFHSSQLANQSIALWYFLGAASLIVLAVSYCSIVFKDSHVHWLKRLAGFCTMLARHIGAPKALFTGVFVLSLFTFQDYVSQDKLALTLVWVIIVYGQPLQRGFNLLRDVGLFWKDGASDPRIIGEVKFRREPGIVGIHVQANLIPQIESLILIPKENDIAQLGIVFDQYRLSDKIWLRVVVFEENVRKRDFEGIWILENSAIACSENQISKSHMLEHKLWKNRSSFIGSVIEGSDINSVRIELYRDSQKLSEGQMLSIEINATPVLYQITNGITKSELLEESNRHGFITIAARKLGVWQSEDSRFDSFPWVPAIHTPVYLATVNGIEYEVTKCIGRVPQSNYGIRVHTDALVTHNTAILGVLGSGKTSLALDLIWRIVAKGIKVWIIDITGQYNDRICIGRNIEKEQEIDKDINSQIENHRKYLNSNKELGGNHYCFRSAIATHIREFMLDQDWRVRVFNPMSFNVTKQTTGVYNNSAGFAKMSPAQITQIVSEEMLKYFDNEMSNKAKLCLVLEEAHSLVPEWNSAVNEGDQQAANGTARAVMQGRKYGFGCILITQRTANVIKSILNQCNTVFGLKIFDDTGKDFLGNYYGTDYSALLSQLPARQCIAYGSALSSQTPLIVELNDISAVEHRLKADSDHMIGVAKNENPAT